MGGTGGLIELVLIFALVFGWGVFELRRTRRDGKKAEAEKNEAEK